MGLLSKAVGKAAGKTSPADILDGMGKALRERLGRLPQKKTTPYTALSLLKAYAAFQAGMCLSLKNGNYASYASVGCGIGEISLPHETIWSDLNSWDKYFKIDPLDIPALSSKKNLIYWVFPLDISARSISKPWDAVMILMTASDSDFMPEVLIAILNDVADKLILPPDQIQSHVPDQMSGDTEVIPPLGSQESGTVEKQIADYYRMHLDFNCIVLECPPAGSEHGVSGQLNFCGKVSAIIEKTGTVIPLPSGRPLILSPIMIDRELIAHRLSKTLDTEVLMSFEANNPENVLIRIDSLI